MLLSHLRFDLFGEHGVHAARQVFCLLAKLVFQLTADDIHQSILLLLDDRVFI